MEKRENQIDNMLIDSSHSNSVTNVQSIRGAECVTDQYMVLMTMRQRIDLKKKRTAKKEISATEKPKLL